MAINTVTLIANSGIQFHTLKVNMEENPELLKMAATYAEQVVEDEKGNKEYSFEFPYYYADRDKYVVREALNPDCKDPATGLIDEDRIRQEFIKEIQEEEIYTVKAIESIETFEGVWLPVPYFRKGTFDDEVQPGPESWARMYISKIPFAEKKDDKYTHNVVFAFDTKCEDHNNPNINKERYFIPSTRDADGTIFICPDDENINYNFCAFEWVQDWIETIYKEKQRALNLRKQDFFFYHIGLFLQFLNLLNKAEAFPPVSLHSNVNTDEKKAIEVDLVLDIGNSRTCGLLFETTKINQAFTFTDALPLEIRDLTYPDRVYSDPFSMRLAFVKANFGINSAYLKTINPEAFTWPSLVRIGNEAERMVVINDDISSNFTMSSPKRYLWDDKKSEFNWEFISDKNKLGSKLSNFAKMQGVNENFTDTGELFIKAEKRAQERGEEPPSKMPDPRFSRRSLMTFVMMEILLQAITFINSYKFRKNRGLEFVPRKLKRILITCPTAMSQMEKFHLRDLAIEAMVSLKEFFGDTFFESIKIQSLEEMEDDLEPSEDEDQEKGLRIVPLPKDVIRPLERRKDWGYDEATCSQLVFIYSEIVNRYRGNTQLYFDTVGKKVADSNNPDTNSLNIASVDIGGGTTDLMICSYQYDPKSDIPVLTPDPLFWEGFNLAGDDILRRLIERIILPGIAEKAEKLGCKDTVKIMRFLFGPDLGISSAEDRMMRRQFASQIAIPIAYGIIQLSTEEKDDERRTFDSFFVNYPRPNKNLIDYINNVFNKEGGIKDFDITKMEWQINKSGINRVVKDVVEKMIADLCTVISQYHCDYLLLAGRPTVLPVIRELFLKYMPLAPDRIVPLGNFRIGTWYPFADATGKITDPKTCVAVGATISLMGGKLNRLEGFRLDTSKLKTKVVSTADFIGKYDPQQSKLTNIYFNDEQNHTTIQFDGPMLIGIRQMNDDDWKATPLYKLGYSSYEAAEKLALRLPLQIDLERDENNKERVKKIRNILDKNGKKVSPNELDMHIQTLAEEYGYWMDTGSFNLPIF